MTGTVIFAFRRAGYSPFERDAKKMLDEPTQLPSSDELWLKWCALDRLIGEADERARKEAGSAFDLYKDLTEGLWAPIFDRLDEVEEQIANMVPATIEDCLIQLRLLKARWECEPSELDDRLVANLLAGVEVMATAGS